MLGIGKRTKFSGPGNPKGRKFMNTIGSFCHKLILINPKHDLTHSLLRHYRIFLNAWGFIAIWPVSEFDQHLFCDGIPT